MGSGKDGSTEHHRWKVLIVDDDSQVASLVQSALIPERCDTRVAHDGSSAIRQVHEFQPDLVLLDIMMPGMNGLEALRQIRRLWHMPVLMVSAVGDEDAVVRCLDEGADDYVNKPFSLRELRARVRACLRRSNAHERQTRDLLLLSNGEMVIDIEANQVFVRGDAVDLTPTEFKLLLVLARNEGRVLTKHYLLRTVWGPGYEDADNSLKTVIARLRSKIETEPSSPGYIHSRWGVGYYLEGL